MAVLACEPAPAPPGDGSASDLDLRRRALVLALLLHAGVGLVIVGGLDAHVPPRPLETFRLMALAEAAAPAPPHIEAAARALAQRPEAPPLATSAPMISPPHPTPAPVVAISPASPPVVTERPLPLEPAPTPAPALATALAGEAAPAAPASPAAASPRPSGGEAGATGAVVPVRSVAAGSGTGAVAAVPDLPAIPLAHGVNPPPEYPASARRRGIEGDVLVQAWVDESGQATRVSLHTASGHAVLDRAALEAVARWRFQPARRQGRTVDAVALVPLSFRLSD